ncbi:MAG TPA: HlyD family efflux transporter periplasmic adaptor subunit [Sulfurovum sp.]|nr:HlyD family efflux transporter periplasmic adaptor subunit [Sulfurovum sp.]
MNKTVKIAITAILLLGGIALFYKNVYLPKSTYEIYHASKGTTAVEVFGIGELSAKNIYPVGTATGGKILSIETDQGRSIKKGDLIASLDPVDLNTRLRAAQNSLTRAKIDLELVKKEHMIAKEQADLTESTYQKDKQVYNAKGISRLAFEQSQTSMQISKGQTEVAKQKIASMKIRLLEIQEEIAGVKKRLEQMTIVSPVDGFVIEKNAEIGQSIPPAFSIVKIVDPETLWIKTWIDERISGKVKVGQKAKIVLRSREALPYAGIVRRIAAVSDAVTQEREVNVGFEKIPEPFYINEQAEVSITIETFKELYKIPLQYIVIYKEKKGIWVRQNRQAHFMVLSIVAEDGEFAGVDKDVNGETEILIPNEKKKPLFEGSTISI